jgi:hypothetical protein
VNKSKWTAFIGFLRGFEALDDARKWRFYTYIFDEQVPPPWESVRRCDDQPGFACAWARPGPTCVSEGDGVRRAPPRRARNGSTP